MRLIAAASLAALMFATPAAAQKKCDIGSPNKPLLGEQVFQIAGPNGSNVGQFRDAHIKVSCGSAPFKWGLADAKGKVLVPAQYYNVVPLTATTAAVISHLQFKSDGNALHYRLYVFGKGETKQILPWSRFGTYSWNGVRAPYAFSVGTGEVALIQGDVAKPLMIRNLGGRGWTGKVDLFYQANNTLIANFTGEDGTPLSRVLDMRGQPISPVIGAIERWETLSPETASSLWRWRNSSQYDYPTIGVDYLSTILTADHAALPYGKLYVPIAANGDPLPLPQDTIGVFPLRFDIIPWSGNTTHGWAIVEETGQGLRVRPGIGTLQSVLARAATLPAYSGLSRYIERNKDYEAQKWLDLLVARPAGESAWRIIDGQTLGKAHADEAGSTGVNPSDTLANFQAARAAARANREAEYQRERLATAARVSKELADRHAMLLSTGTICQWRPGEPLRGTLTINHMLANCPITNDAFFNYARSLGADPALLGKAEYKFWEAKGRYAVPIPAAPNNIYATPNWNAWGNSIIQSSKESTDTFIRDSKRQYYDNMEKWNRGKQNWCC